PRVLSRLLDGYDHVIRSSSSGIQVDVVGAAQTAKFTASAAAAETPPANASPVPGGTSNVDQDEENAQPKPAPRPQNLNLAAAPHPIPPPRAISANAQHSGAPRVSSNLDLDEETSQ